MDVNAVVQQWKSVTEKVEAVDYATTGYDYDLSVAGEKVRDFAALMLKEGFYLVDLMAVHIKPAVEVVYQFAHVATRCRVMARAFVNAQSELPTISDIYQGANWHERETRDFHGVVFVGHPNLEPLILAEEDVDLKPLLKSEKALKDAADVRRAGPADEAAKPEAAKQSEQS